MIDEQFRLFIDYIQDNNILSETRLKHVLCGSFKFDDVCSLFYGTKSDIMLAEYEQKRTDIEKTINRLFNVHPLGSPARKHQDGHKYKDLWENWRANPKKTVTRHELTQHDDLQQQINDNLQQQTNDDLQQLTHEDLPAIAVVANNEATYEFTNEGTVSPISDVTSPVFEGFVEAEADITTSSSNRIITDKSHRIVLQSKSNLHC